MTYRSYLRKYEPLQETPAEEYPLLAFLESLNEMEWAEFIRDLVLDAPQATEVLRPPRGEDILAYATSVFERLSPVTQRLIGLALQRIVSEHISLGKDKRHEALVNGALSVADILPHSVSTDFLLQLIQNTEIPEETRVHAADVLAAREDSALSAAVWEKLPLDEVPHLSPSVVSGLSIISPRQAIRILFRFRNPPVDSQELLYPLRFAIRRLLQSICGPSDLRLVAEQAPQWLRDLVYEILGFAEFQEIVFDDQRWTSFVDRIRRDGCVRFRYTGYLHGKLFRGQEIPSCFIRFLGEVKKAIITATSLQESNVRLRQTETRNFAALVDDAFSWKIPLAEPGYAGERRLEKGSVFQIGSISYLGIVIPTFLLDRFYLEFIRLEKAPHDLRPTSSELRKYTLGPLKQVYRYCIQNEVEVFVQPSGVISEELEGYIQQFEEIELLVSRPDKAIIEPQDATREMRECVKRGRKSVVFLDWKSAVEVDRETPQEASLFLVRYDVPLSVGFFYPKDSVHFFRVLLQAVERSLVKDEEWDNEFKTLLTESFVELWPQEKVLSHAQTVLSRLHTRA
jgi:hypothetical protein